MQITGLIQTKNPNLFKIAVDNEIIGLVNPKDIELLNLAPNLVINETELAKINEVVSYNKFYYQAVRYADMSQKTKQKCAYYLRQKGCPKEYIDKIIDALISLNLINDSEIARSYINRSLNSGHISKELLINKLISKQISVENINKAFDDVEYNNLDQLKELVSRKKDQYSYKNDQNKFIRYLISKGFKYEDIKRVLN